MKKKIIISVVLLFLYFILVTILFPPIVRSSVFSITFVLIIFALLIIGILKTLLVFGRNNQTVNNLNIPVQTQVNAILKCSKCGNIVSINDKFCGNCGTLCSKDSVQVVQNVNPIVEFDQTYLQSEKNILKFFIMDELKAQGENGKTFITKSLNTKKNILIAMIGITTVLSTIMYFFNLPFVTCLELEFMVLLLYYFINKRFNVINVLTKQAMKNPNEDISNMVKKLQEQRHNSVINEKLKVVIVILIAILLPSIFFWNPKVLYVRYEDGYSVFHYTRGVINNDNTVNIPSTYKGKKVLSIGESAFENSNVKKVILPHGLESIKTKAFYNAKRLTEIDIPSTVVEIRGSAFEDCINLTTVKLHDGLKEIRGSVFKNNVSLVNIELPDTLEYLGASAFAYCNSITEITIPKKVIEINGQTFEYCTSLRKINMHDDIISIHGEVFVGDVNLNNVILPPKITEIRGNTFEGCSSLTSIVIPDGVTRIGGHAFYDCSSLSDVSIPSTVVEIGSSAFRRCDSLYSIKVPYRTIINERAFKESPTSIQRY